MWPTCTGGAAEAPPAQADRRSYPLSQTQKRQALLPSARPLLTTDLRSSAKQLLQIYFDRWQIEVNHRGENDTLDLGQAQLLERERRTQTTLHGRRPRALTSTVLPVQEVYERMPRSFARMTPERRVEKCGFTLHLPICRAGRLIAVNSANSGNDMIAHLPD
jgi:hypothetical protein